jgi:hypothetical protein
MQAAHPHAQGYTESQHYIPPPHALPASGIPDQMRYGEQAAYPHMRPMYPQMFYDPSMAGTPAADYSIDPSHPAPPHGAGVYSPITPRSPVAAFSPQTALVPPFHSTTTPPVPQGPWTPATQYYGSFGGMAGPPSQPPLADEMGHRPSIPSVYLSHAPTSAWSSPVISSPFQFFSPFQGSSPQMDRGESMGPPTAEQWAPSPSTGRQPMRAPYVPGGPQPPGGGPAAWSSNLGPTAPSLDSKRPSVSAPSDDPTAKASTAAPSHAPQPSDKERKEYHPQPPARRSEWVMWVGNV